MPKASSPPELSPHLDAIGRAWVGIEFGSGGRQTPESASQGAGRWTSGSGGPGQANAGSPLRVPANPRTRKSSPRISETCGWRLGGPNNSWPTHAMTAIGFTWARETAVEVERTGRKVQLEEVVGIAALFGIPIIESPCRTTRQQSLWEAPPSTDPHAQLSELMLGRGGKIGNGGADWLALLYIVGGGKTIERPAVDLSANTAEHHLVG